MGIPAIPKVNREALEMLFRLIVVLSIGILISACGGGGDSVGGHDTSHAFTTLSLNYVKFVIGSAFLAVNFRAIRLLF